jgi:uncharacterized protein YeaO (DUF488 family)
VDRDHLKQLCTKFNPSNLPWVNFLLATFEHQRDQLWRNFFEKYELGPKPVEPTWGKGIRKQRWSEYGAQLDAWEAKKAELVPQFKRELAQWEEKRKAYDERHKSQQDAMAGTALLQRALGSGVTLVGINAAPPPQPSATQVSFVCLSVSWGFALCLCDILPLL